MKRHNVNSRRSARKLISNDDDNNNVDASITVSVRVRPGAASTISLDPSDGHIRINGRSFGYASSVVKGSDQIVAYESLGVDLFGKLRDGYDCTLLAYGQTGSGKTYTMFGPPGSLTEASLAKAKGEIPPAWGVFPRLMMNLLNEPDLGTLAASAIEVYQDRAYDLLNKRKHLTVGGTRSQSTGLVVNGKMHPVSCYCRICHNSREQKKEMQHKHGNTIHLIDDFCTNGEQRWPLRTPNDIACLARTVEATRVAQGHLLNARSSRSHCLVRLHLTRNSRDITKEQQFVFVDLAGSERIGKSGVTGIGKSEALKINSSLTCLGRVIKSLGEGSKHVPYRTSTLTMLLRSSFGGKSVTSVVVNVSSDPQHIEESVCSLKFGERMVRVKNRATIVSGVSMSAETDMLVQKLKKAHADLQQMKDKKMCGHFGANSTQTEINSITENIRRLQLYEKQAWILQIQKTELEGMGNCQNDQVLKDIVDKMHASRLEASNLRDIIARQKTIKGLWIEATPAYKKKEAEVLALETKLRQLGTQ